jgi:dTDP-3-amino-2,3,6-trideoxy-4-keto-D-glucose/dTDP-3-amino-3,4,6-trideoxy-alpha-D-glucose/dTDP-2,6-dideoxy-D-kanosamine transaminase
MRIGVWDYRDEYASERDDILHAVDQVFSSGRLILGDSVARFEAAFSHYCGARFGVGVDNGTNAIALGLRALGLEPGDEVITVSNTAAPTVVAISQTGGVARFVDISSTTYLMDVSQLEAAITPRTRFIVPVHLFGQCVDMGAVMSIAKARGLQVLEDCAQAHGAEQHGCRAGGIGDAAAFSFYPTKVLGAYGDGGMTITSTEEVNTRLRQLRYYGMGERYYVLGPGFNARLDEVHAEILLRKLRRLEHYIDRRRAIAARYNEALSGTELVLPTEQPGNRHVYYLYVVRHPRRDAILERLRESDVHLNISYPWPIHTMIGFEGLGYRSGQLPRTEAAAREIFSLPMYPSLSDAQQNRVCDLLRDAVATV